MLIDICYQGREYILYGRKGRRQEVGKKGSMRRNHCPEVRSIHVRTSEDLQACRMSGKIDKS